MSITKILLGIAIVGGTGVTGTFAVRKFFFETDDKSPKGPEVSKSTGGGQTQEVTTPSGTNSTITQTPTV